MLLQPKNRTFRKDKKSFFKRNNKQQAILSNAHSLQFGSFGLKTLETNLLKASHLEAIRRVMIRDLRKKGKIWFRIFPSKPITSKPLKTRMGKGKGSVQFWVCPVKPGQILFEISGGFSQDYAKEILQIASQKLPVKTKFVTRSSAAFRSEGAATPRALCRFKETAKPQVLPPFFCLPDLLNDARKKTNLFSLEQNDCSSRRGRAT